MTVTLVLYADTMDELKAAFQNELLRRANSLRNSGRTKTEKKECARAAFELEQEAQWLDRTVFKPRSEYPFPLKAKQGEKP